jgi:hypothetical protein
MYLRRSCRALLEHEAPTNYECAAAGANDAAATAFSLRIFLAGNAHT